jgi:hypothetical protein
MRLDIYGQFVVSVITPKGGWSKGRPLAVIEDREACHPIDMLIPNNLTEDQLQRYLANRFSTFAKPGSKIRRLDAADDPSPSNAVDIRNAYKFTKTQDPPE